MSRLLIILAAIALSACCNKEDSAKAAITEVIKNCAEPASVELRLSTYGSNDVTVRCNRVGIPVFKEGRDAGPS